MSSLRQQCCSLALTALLTAPTVTFAEEPARVVPAFQDGKPIGFGVLRIQKGSRLEALGLKDKDVVQSADGAPVRAPAEMAALLRRVEAGERPALTVLREGVRTQLP
jgi:general secretion pathway protein C